MQSKIIPQRNISCIRCDDKYDQTFLHMASMMDTCYPCYFDIHQEEFKEHTTCEYCENMLNTQEFYSSDWCERCENKKDICIICAKQKTMSGKTLEAYEILAEKYPDQFKTTIKRYNT